MSTRIAELTETQVLEEIRKNFENDSLNGIDTESLIASCGTLEELLIKIRTAIELRDSGENPQ